MGRGYVRTVEYVRAHVCPLAHGPAACRKINLNGRPDASDPDVARVIGKKLEWGGCSGCLTLEPDGTLLTSWGKGRWGKTSTASFKRVIFAKFVDVVHLLRLDASGAFLSTRCSDGEELHGKVM